MTVRGSSSRHNGLGFVAKAGICAALVAIASVIAYRSFITRTPGYPSLTNEQRARMEDALYQYKGHYVRIVACKQEECQAFARELNEIFDAAKWEHAPDSGAKVDSSWVTVSGPRRDPAVAAVVDQLNQVLAAPVYPPTRDDGGATEIVVGEFVLPGRESANSAK